MQLDALKVRRHWFSPDPVLDWSIRFGVAASLAGILSVPLGPTLLAAVLLPLAIARRRLLLGWLAHLLRLGPYLPLAWLALFYSYVARVALTGGGLPDPATLHYQAVVWGLRVTVVALPFSGLLPFVGQGISRFLVGRELELPENHTILFHTLCGWGMLFLLVFADPGGWLRWFY